MILIRTLLALVLCLCAATDPTPAIAPDAMEARDPREASFQEPEWEGEQIRAFRVQHAGAEEVAELVRNLLENEFAQCVTDERTQQIFFKAEAAVMEQAADLIKSLDQHIEEQHWETAILTPRFRRAQDLEDFVKLQASRKGQMIVDHARNVIVLQDTPEAIGKARDILAQMDQPVADLQIHFLVLGRSDEPLPGTPRMAKVNQELDALGLSGYGVLSRAAVVTQENTDFSLNGVNEAGTLQVGGDIHLLNADGKAELSLQLEVHVDESDSRAQVETTVKIPLNHLMILGITPAGGRAGQPLVLVAEARKL